MMDFNDTISLKDAIAYLDSGQPFSLSVITYDKKRKKGGEWLEIKSAVKHMFLSSEDQKKLSAVQPVSSGFYKDPHHYENSTRNIKFENGEIRKIHLRLIRLFNNKTVL